jgi:hypothetical protein
MKRKYTRDDLTIRPTNRQLKNGQSIAHTHEVEFARSLTREEQLKFKRVIISFYDCVYFSGGIFGNGIKAEPLVVFPTRHLTYYTLYQKNTAGSWKELLFAMLATFSYEVAEIARNDGNSVFAHQFQMQEMVQEKAIAAGKR